MSNAIIIEIAGEPAGIVTADANGFAFFAASKPFYPLDNHTFRSLRQAEKALSRLVARRRRLTVLA
ncbi:hypothetical protein [uncultured Alsobacter sp.]|uniref:hypothetical protein n=1 Tax=uncultured Alsobacter sp. TaxID=1748258 RepID=UPI0025CE4425|nr:hypothetical protein [uncultured Alsobacter sp.]